jgi:glycosyltransferase involved in cell wall biosynthesis
MGKTNKILMVVENLSVPTDPRVWAEARTLREAGYQVSIICPKGCGRDEESYVCIDDIFIYRYRINVMGNRYTAYSAEYGIALVKTFLLSFKVLFRHGFDVVHAANPPDIFFIIGLFYRLLGKKYLFDQHDLSPEMFKVKFKGRMEPLYKLLLYLEECSYQTSHLVITSNFSQQKLAVERGHCPASKVFVVRNGPNWSQRQAAAPEVELKKGWRFLLAFIGIMSSQDGVEYALYALHDLVHKRGYQDVSLMLMGDGDNAPALQALAHELELDEYVNFVGWVNRNDISRFLAMIDVGLTPDPQNGLNEYSTMIKTMEYMAVGKPVVAFDLQETRFLAQDAALYATPNKVEDFADKIETLLNNEELRNRMGAFGRKRVEEELSWEHSRQNLLLAYEAIFPLRSEPSVSNSAEVLTGG